MFIFIIMAVLAAIFCYSMIARGGADAGRSRVERDEAQVTAIASPRKAVTS